MKKIIILLLLLLLPGCSLNQVGKVDDTKVISSTRFVENGKVKIKKRVIGKELEKETLDGREEDITRRTSKTRVFVSGNTETLRVYQEDNFIEDNGKWYKIDEVIEDEKEVLLGDTATTTSGAGDGQVIYTSNDTSWQTTHDAAVGTFANYTNASANIGTRDLSFIGDQYQTQRVFLPFNTSAIPSTSTITSASVNLYFTAALIGVIDSYSYLSLTETNQPNSGTLSTSDFNNCGATSSPTLGSDNVLAGTVSSTLNSYHSFSLNDTGIGWIKRGSETSTCGTTAGYTCIGLREGHDIDNVDPVNNIFLFTVSMSEAAGTTQDPYIDITYMFPVFGTNQAIIFN